VDVEKLEKMLGAGPMAILATNDVLSAAGFTVPIGRGGGRQLCSTLHRHGLGVEPDPRFCPASPEAGGDVVMFRISPSAPPTPSPAYVSAEVAAFLAVVLAASDRVISDEEVELLERRLTDGLELTAAERLRLEAHINWLLSVNPAPPRSALRRRLSGLDLDYRRHVGWFLVRVAAADGHVHPLEHAWLVRFFGMLDLSEEDLSRMLMRLGDVKREWEYATLPNDRRQRGVVRRDDARRTRSDAKGPSIAEPKLEKADALLDLLFGS
jgi:hypothetical protein